MRPVCVRTEHILRERGQILIEDGEGKKCRYTVLSPKLLQQLRPRWRIYRPADHWPFPSEDRLR